LTFNLYCFRVLVTFEFAMARRRFLASRDGGSSSLSLSVSASSFTCMSAPRARDGLVRGGKRVRAELEHIGGKRARTNLERFGGKRARANLECIRGKRVRAERNGGKRGRSGLKHIVGIRARAELVRGGKRARDERSGGERVRAGLEFIVGMRARAELEPRYGAAVVVAREGKEVPDARQHQKLRCPRKLLY